MGKSKKRSRRAKHGRTRLDESNSECNHREDITTLPVESQSTADPSTAVVPMSKESSPYPHSERSRSKPRTRHMKLRTSLFTFDMGTKMPLYLFHKLLALQLDIVEWLEDGRLPNRALGSHCGSHIITSTHDFRNDLDKALADDTTNFDVLCQYRDKYTSLYHRGHTLQDTLKEVIPLAPTNKVRPLLDALTHLGESIVICSSRAEHVDMLLAQYCSEDSESVRTTLCAKLTLALAIEVGLPSGGSERALMTLAPGQWLSDEIINSVLILIPSADGVLILDTLFYVHVSAGNWERLPKHNLLVRNGPGLRTQPWKRIIFPLHEAGNHWICVCLDFEEKSVTVYDSLAYADHSHSRATIMKNLKRLVSFISFGQPSNVPPSNWTFCPNYFKDVIQENGHECGVYAILFALHLRGGDIDGGHIPQYLRIPRDQDSLNGLRLLILDMILGYRVDGSI